MPQDYVAPEKEATERIKRILKESGITVNQLCAHKPVDLPPGEGYFNPPCHIVAIDLQVQVPVPYREKPTSH